jgi:sulfur relay (sulfurtransferase) DsrF/TusC family protein
LSNSDSKTVHSKALALLVRTPPYKQRSARCQLDVALVGAALGKPLQLYFMGDAAMQLIKPRELKSAGLPTGLRAWASLPEMTDVETYIETAWLERLIGLDLILNPQPLTVQQMRGRWQNCEKVLVL